MATMKQSMAQKMSIKVSVDAKKLNNLGGNTRNGRICTLSAKNSFSCVDPHTTVIGILAITIHTDSND
jgi:hypothetical protein